VAVNNPDRRRRLRARDVRGSALAATAIAALAVAPAAGAHGLRRFGGFAPQRSSLQPNSLVISTTVFPHDGIDVTAGQNLPFVDTYAGGSLKTVEKSGASLSAWAPATFAQAVIGGQYPEVFNNASSDASFGVDTPIDLWDLTLGGHPLEGVQVPTSQMVTSFESKSELAVNVATNGQSISFSGYAAPNGSVDASNSNTPGVFDFTNPDVSGENGTYTAGGYYRVAGDLSSDGNWTFTDTNSYSGDNERAVLLDSADNEFLAAGNDNNGNSNKVTDPALEPLAGDVFTSLGDDTGAQSYPESFRPQSEQSPLTPPATLAGTFTYAPSDKAGKDTNFRGLTEYNNVVYYTKGSGSNGSNTVYFINTSATACPTTDVSGNNVPEGLPTPGAQLPQPGQSYPMCILKGFNDSAAATDTTHFPFGLWFANKDTLYVADEGSGSFGDDPASADPTSPYADAAESTTAGLQKWVLNRTTQQWQLAYTLQSGLNLGEPYTVPGYPTGDNTAAGGSGLPWAPATDGLRNITGHVNGNGTVTIYATTSTVSGSGDQGGDPNQVVAVTDELGATGPGHERFSTVDPARFGVRYGGVAVLPATWGAHGHKHGFGFGR
jgi:hypothetical protein